MSKKIIEQLVTSSLRKLKDNGYLLMAEMPTFQVDVGKDKSHGDFSSNAALVLAKSARRQPRELAEMIVKSLPQSPYIQKVEVAGAGFINFFLTSQVLFQV